MLAGGVPGPRVREEDPKGVGSYNTSPATRSRRLRASLSATAAP